MISLSHAQFKPTVILLSLIFVPLILATLILCLLDNMFDIFMLFVCLTVSYTLIIIILSKIFKRNKYCLVLYDAYFVATYPNLGKRCGHIQVTYEDIVRLEYYKISSLKSWLLLFNYVVPQSVFITYKCKNEIITELLGYMEYEEIKKLTAEKGISLKIN